MELSKPGAIIEHTLRKEILREIFVGAAPVDRLLDLGCGDRPYREIYEPCSRESIGADLPDSPFAKRDVDIFCRAEDIAAHLEAGSIDLLLSTEVLHDIAEPGQFFEAARTVLRPGGHLVLTTPFMVPICDGEYDHYRYTPVALKYLCENHGFEVQQVRPVANLFGTTIQFAAKPQMRLWNRLARMTGLKFFGSCLNPFVFLFVALPQFVYLGCHRVAASLPRLARAFRGFDYGATGYVTHARKRSDGE